MIPVPIPISLILLLFCLILLTLQLRTVIHQSQFLQAGLTALETEKKQTENKKFS